MSAARQVLKLYAWEASFEKQVLDIRSQEIGVLKKTAYLNAFFQFIWSSAPFAVSPGSGSGAGVVHSDLEVSRMPAGRYLKVKRLPEF